MSSENSSWHKSSYSGNTGHCIEVREGTLTDVRDTQNRDQGHLTFTGQEWTAVLAVTKG
jgi:monoamine oxidase